MVAGQGVSSALRVADPFAEAAPKALHAVIEDARLAALNCYRSLDANDVAGLSRLSEHAASCLGATQASVSFVDADRVWFGGAFGFDYHETSRESSFCDAVVRSASPLLVADGQADPRFWRHDMVRGEPGLRGYAGAPLIDAGGYTLGTVAVYSVQPNAFSPRVLHDLSSLAQLVREFLAESRATPPAGRLPGPARRVQGWLGVKTLSTEQGRQGRLAGLVVLSVAKGSPAHRSGLRPTDILIAIGGQELFNTRDVATAMAGRVAGALVQVQFRRSGQWQQLDVEIKQRRTRVSGR